MNKIKFLVVVIPQELEFRPGTLNKAWLS